ncbi:DUF4097 family beta strand repeat-containing protein [Bacillus alkalicellulosilyticus]|uniref:DUF4097 family beta strand repeat-containing protein n=1 Tax=Alkalihalobacterium alkalicellulosilyticum TaxID=1912214 RepID=UPI001482A349|nr:DUF4097 family beta strand repeat-containing protein [Bacillus alkalicellulosilyticus]
MKKIFGVLLIVIGFIIALNAIGMTNTSQPVIKHEKQEITEFDKIIISARTANIEVETTTNSELTLEVKSDSNDIKVSKEESGSTLTFNVEEPKGWFAFGKKSIKVIVSLPEAYKDTLDISTNAGNISFSDELHIQELVVRTTAGNIKDISGEIEQVTIKSTAGNISGYDLITTQTDIKATAGNITFDGFTGSITGSNSAGNTNVDYNDVNGNVDFKSSAGNIKLTIPNPSFVLDAKVSVGDIKVDVPIMLESSSKQNYQGTVNDGLYTINLSASAGNIKIE